MNKRTILRLAFVTFIISIFVLLLLISANKPLSNPHGTFNKNAMWLRHQWVGESRTEEEYKELADNLRSRNITDAYFHVGPLNAKGKIEEEKYRYATYLLEAMERYYSELNTQAWIGQVEKKGGGPLDTSDKETLNNIIQTARIFADLGFDGIHYNIEPIYSGDENIIILIKETKEVTGGKIVSIASDELEIFPGAEGLIRNFSNQTGFWNREYYRRIAVEADQIAVMMYDTALPLSSLFTILVEWQTRNLIEEIGGNTTLFIGVPTYEDKRWSFHPRAENMRSGLTGVQKGLKTFTKEELSNFGVAIYAEWTTDESEWDLYERSWLGIQ